MFSVIGIDWGEKYCGISLGDPISRLILPHNSLIQSSELFEILPKLVSKHPVNKIIIGKPTSFSGNPTKISQKIDLLIERLKLAFPPNIVIETVNERESSKIASENLHFLLPRERDGAVHNQSAAIILKNYFDQRSG